MKKILCSSFFVILFSACDKELEIVNDDANQLIVEEAISRPLLLKNYEISEEDIYYLQRLGFSGSPISVYKNSSELKDDFISYVVEGDIEKRSLKTNVS